MAMHETLAAFFPRLSFDSYRKTSECDPTYNCIAWAAEDTRRWWWPMEGYYWPSDVPKELSLDAFIQLFMRLGYAPCESDEREEGFDKVALFAKAVDGSLKPQHAARQLLNGRWTSKLGNLWDIEHELFDLNSDAYGQPLVFMKRAIL